MHNIGRSLNGLKVVTNDAKKLTDMINGTADLAENVSAKVRRLDKARVSFINLNLKKIDFCNIFGSLIFPVSSI